MNFIIFHPHWKIQQQSLKSQQPNNRAVERSHSPNDDENSLCGGHHVFQCSNMLKWSKKWPSMTWMDKNDDLGYPNFKKPPYVFQPSQTFRPLGVGTEASFKAFGARYGGAWSRQPGCPFSWPELPGQMRLRVDSFWARLLADFICI